MAQQISAPSPYFRLLPRTKVIEAQGAPTNAAMLLGDEALPGPDDQIQPARENMLPSPRSPSRTMRIFSSAGWCFRVRRRMAFTIGSAVGFAVSVTPFPSH